MAAPQLLIDTNIVIDRLRQRADTFAIALQRYESALSTVSLYELLAVPTMSERQRVILGAMLSQVTLLPFDEIAAREAANVWNILQKQGQLIGALDTQIAGVCLANRLPLLTRNVSHFRRVPELSILTPEDLSP